MNDKSENNSRPQYVTTILLSTDITSHIDTQQTEATPHFCCAGILVYRLLPAPKKVQKIVHATVNGTAFLLGVVGVYAAFKYHNESGIANLYSLHSWFGMITIVLFGIQVRHFKSPLSSLSQAGLCPKRYARHDDVIIIAIDITAAMLRPHTTALR